MSYWEHIKEAYDKVSIYDGGVTFRWELARLPAHIGDLLAAHWTQRLQTSLVALNEPGLPRLRRSAPRVSMLEPPGGLLTCEPLESQGRIAKDLVAAVVFREYVILTGHTELNRAVDDDRRLPVSPLKNRIHDLGDEIGQFSPGKSQIGLAEIHEGSSQRQNLWVGEVIPPVFSQVA